MYMSTYMLMCGSGYKLRIEGYLIIPQRALFCQIIFLLRQYKALEMGVWSVS